MTALKLIGFSGEIPRVQPRQLPEPGAQYSLDCRLEDGSLVPVNQTRFVIDLSSLALDEIKTIYRFGDDWLGWATHVNAVTGPVATERLYYTGDGVPKMRVGSTIYDLALEAPDTALSGALSGAGSGDIITLLYVYTRVTEYGEESEPSPASAEINWQAGKTVTLSGFVAAPGGRAYSKQRIYRSQTSASGTGFFLIAERSDTASDYADVVSLTDINDPLPSTDYNPPPDDLEGLIALPNGMMAAFSPATRSLCFCEPYKPHAWPEKYRLTMDYDPQALAAIGTSVVVATTGTPYIAQGTAPENMVMERIETNLPCINKRSMVDLGYAVAYASHDGLVVVSQGAARVVTDNIVTRKQWQGYNPGIMVASQYNGRYFASYEYVDDEGNAAIGTFAIDLTGQQPYLLRYSIASDASFYDIEDGTLYVLIGQEVFEFDSLTTTPSVMLWKSKLFVLPRPDNFGAIYVDGGDRLTPEEEAERAAELAAALEENEALYYGFGYTQYIPLFSSLNGPMYNVVAINGNSSESWNGTVNGVPSGSMGSEINGAPVNGYMLGGDGLTNVANITKTSIVRVYADNRLVASVTDMNKVVRLPSGFRARTWEVEVEGKATVYEIGLATTASELRAV